MEPGSTTPEGLNRELVPGKDYFMIRFGQQPKEKTLTASP